MKFLTRCRRPKLVDSKGLVWTNTGHRVKNFTGLGPSPSVVVQSERAPPRWSRREPSFRMNPAITYSLGVTQYHRPELRNDRVRNGNGCVQSGFVTGDL